mgnify:CR=1 FL=1
MPTSSSAALLLLVATPVAAFTAPGMLTMRQKTAAPLSPRAVDPSMEMSLFTEIFEGTVNAIPILLPAAVVSVIGLDRAPTTELNHHACFSCSVTLRTPDSL